MFAWLTALIKDWPNLINRVMSWFEAWSIKRRVERINKEADDKLKEHEEYRKARRAERDNPPTDGGVR
jgi:hypothetical protein